MARKLMVLGTASYVGKSTPVCGIVPHPAPGRDLLGESVSDPFAVETGGKTKGLGLLPTQTEMAWEKVAVESSGHSFLGVTAKGYEIHMGRTARLAATAREHLDISRICEVLA